jgi:hypothetical protein
MVGYFRLLVWTTWHRLFEAVAMRFGRCPVCWAPTIPNRSMMHGGIFDFRLCSKCFGMFDFVNVTPERTPEENAVDLPF